MRESRRERANFGKSETGARSSEIDDEASQSEKDSERIREIEIMRECERGKRAHERERERQRERAES